MTWNFSFTRPLHKSSRSDFEMLGCFGRVEPFDRFHTHHSSFVRIGLLPREAKPDHYLSATRIYVIRKTAIPSVLVEPGFLTNPREAALISRPEIRQRIADLLAEAIISKRRM